MLSKDNNKLGNEGFDTKKIEVFSGSAFKLNQEISKEQIWSLTEINKFQDKMANWATQIW